ncbi:hypothetical protein AWR38_05010 [Idiomarina sp. WRN-38]|nr:hypothetical protein AUR68_04995 [Idiomarina sp. H105]OAE90780.1 hypothetical protein AWR38_05010 [Idiomarina sp. WRN-38]
MSFMNHHKSVTVLTDEYPISLKTKHLLINLIEWTNKNNHRRFVLTTEKREENLQLQSSDIGVYVKNNYHAELTELVTKEYLVTSNLSKGDGRVSFSVTDFETDASNHKPPFSEMAIKLITSNRGDTADLLNVSQDKLDDTENFKVVSKGQAQKSNAIGAVRFMRPQQITFGTLLCLANEYGIIKTEHGELASLLGIKTKTLRNHLSQFRKLGLLSEQVGGFVGSGLMGKAKSTLILKPDIVVKNYKLDGFNTEIILVDNPVRQTVSLMLDLADLTSSSQRLTALRELSKQHGIKLGIPKELGNNDFAVLRKLFKAKTHLEDRPYKHLCLLIEAIVIDELKHSSFPHSDSAESKGHVLNTTPENQYALLLNEISKVISGPLTKSIECNDTNTIRKAISSFMASAAIGLLYEIQNKVINSPPFSDKPSDELRQKKFMLYPAGKNFFSSSQKLLVVG